MTSRVPRSWWRVALGMPVPGWAIGGFPAKIELLLTSSRRSRHDTGGWVILVDSPGGSAFAANALD